MTDAQLMALVDLVALELKRRLDRNEINDTDQHVFSNAECALVDLLHTCKENYLGRVLETTA